MGACGSLDGVPDQEGREGGAAKHHQAHGYGVGDCSRGDGCCLRYGEGGNPMSDDSGDPGHHQGRLPPCRLHPGERLEETGSGLKMIGDFLTKMKRVGTVWVSTWWTRTSPPSSTPGKPTLSQDRKLHCGGGCQQNSELWRRLLGEHLHGKAVAVDPDRQ